MNLKHTQNFVRLYELKAPAAVGLKTYLLQKYQSLIECGQVLYEVEGVTMRILKLAFDPDHEKCRADFSDAEVMKVMIGRRAVTYTAMSDKKRVDEKGTFVPRLCQNLIIANVTEEMADCVEVVKEFVKKFADIDEQNFEIIKFYNPKRAKFFEGRVTIPVENMKVLPLKFNKMPGVKFCPEAKKYVKDENTLVNVEVSASGYSMDKNLPRQKRFRKSCSICGSEEHLKIACPNKPPVKCFICGEEGHLQSECRFFKPRQQREFKCNECGAVGPSCSHGFCANVHRINMGRFLDRKERVQNMPSESEIDRRLNRLKGMAESSSIAEKRPRDSDDFATVTKRNRRQTQFGPAIRSKTIDEIWDENSKKTGVRFEAGASNDLPLKNKFEGLDMEWDTPENTSESGNESDVTVVNVGQK